MPKPSPAASVGGKAKWFAVAAACVLLGVGGFYLAAALQPAALRPPSNDRPTGAGSRGGTAKDGSGGRAGQGRRSTPRRRGAPQGRRRSGASRDRRPMHRPSARWPRHRRSMKKPRRVPRSLRHPLSMERMAAASARRPWAVLVAAASYRSRCGLLGTTLSGQAIFQHCGAVPLSLTVSSSGEIAGAVPLPDVQTCAPINGAASGRVTSQGMQIELRGPGIAAPWGVDQSGQSMAAAVPANSGPNSGRCCQRLGRRLFRGVVQFGTGGQAGGVRPLRADLRVSQGRLTRSVRPSDLRGRPRSRYRSTRPASSTARSTHLRGSQLRDERCRGQPER